MPRGAPRGRNRVGPYSTERMLAKVLINHDLIFDKLLSLRDKRGICHSGPKPPDSLVSVAGLTELNGGFRLDVFSTPFL